MGCVYNNIRRRSVYMPDVVGARCPRGCTYREAYRMGCVYNIRYMVWCVHFIGGVYYALLKGGCVCDLGCVYNKGNDVVWYRTCT